MESKIAKEIIRLTKETDKLTHRLISDMDEARKLVAEAKTLIEKITKQKE